MEINEKKIKEILRSQRNEYQRYLGVLAEKFEPQLKLMAESVLGIQNQLISLRDMAAQNTEDITKLQIHVSAIREMAAKNTEDIEIIRMDMHTIKDDLKEKISREEFRVIEKRVGLLEKKFQKI